MINYLDLYQRQLLSIPSSGYKTQLVKYGHSIIDSIIRKNLLYLLSETTTYENNIMSEMYSNFKSENIDVYFNNDLGVSDELVYGTKLNISKVNSSIDSMVSSINGIVMSYVSLMDLETHSMSISELLNIENKIIIVGNNTINNLPVSNVNVNPKFIRSIDSGSLLFHTSLLKPNEVFIIDLINKPFLWNILKPLTVDGNRFKHSSILYLHDKSAIEKILING